MVASGTDVTGGLVGLSVRHWHVPSRPTRTCLPETAAGAKNGVKDEAKDGQEDGDRRWRQRRRHLTEHATESRAGHTGGQPQRLC